MVMIVLQSIAITALLYISFICMCSLNNKKAKIKKEKRDE